MTKLPSQDVVGKPATAVFEQWSALKEQIPVSKPDAAARSVALPVRLHEQDLWLSFVAVRGAEGTVYAFRDVTAERELEQQKTDFISIVSHELRTPLTGIYGAAQRRFSTAATSSRRRSEKRCSSSSRLRPSG